MPTTPDPKDHPTPAEALAIMADGDSVHTLVNLPPPSLIACLYAEAIARGDSLGPVYYVDVATVCEPGGCMIMVATWLDAEIPDVLPGGMGQRSNHRAHLCISGERKVDGWSVMDRLWFRARPVDVLVSQIADVVAAEERVS